ncbi:MAG TPA: rhodanese-like domain-containing protein [Terriglobales bacterium]|nr:rhodanese-like domain-containing protein [Terriglobales bacterium]
MKARQNRWGIVAISLLFIAFAAMACPGWARGAEEINSSGKDQGPPRLIEPAELAKLLAGPDSGRPLILQVGFRLLYEQAHIPGAEYVGAASEEAGQQRLRHRVQGLSRDRFIVLYCGCCPWSHCPNVQPAYKQLQAMGFRNVKLLYIATNFGTDWVDKGYPVSKQ